MTKKPEEKKDITLDEPVMTTIV